MVVYYRIFNEFKIVVIMVLMKTENEILELKKLSKTSLKKHQYYRQKNLLENSIVLENLAKHHLNIYVDTLSLISLNEILLGI